MDPLTAEVVVDVPRERAFDVVADLANHPAWIDHYVTDFRLSRLQSAGEGAAARFRIDAPVAVLAVWGEIIIRAVERPYRIRGGGGAGRLGRVPWHSGYEFVELPGGLTRISWTIWTEPSKRIDRLREKLGGRGFFRRKNGIALRRLKDLLEADADLGQARASTGGGDRVLTGIP